MDVPTRSNRTRNWRAAGAVLLGLLAVAAVPAGIAVASYTDVELIDAGWAAAPAAVLGLLALWLARRARRRTERTIGRVGGVRTARTARFLGALGIYLAAAAGLAVAFYYVLEHLSV
jgi:hypothetical protein